MSIFRNAKGLAVLMVLAFLILLIPEARVLSQEVTPSDNEVNRIASELYCPVCENVPLDECPTFACEQWRGLIRQKLAEGWSDVDIKDYFVSQYGDRVLGAPPRQGLNWLLYFLPPIMIVAGLVMLVFKLKRPTEEHPAGVHIENDPYRERVERDLENMG